MSAMTIGEVMTPKPATIDRDANLAEAHVLMRKLHVRHLPVVSRGKLVGVLSARNLDDGELVGDAMTAAVYTTTADAHVRDVARVMAAEKYGCAVVLDGGQVSGIFTTTDALRYLVSTLP